jgi:hypothetical protein
VFRYQVNDLTYEGKELPAVLLNFTIDSERMFELCDCPNDLLLFANNNLKQSC